MVGRCFIIAEAGVNHNGDLVLAKRLVDVACEAKADAVKFQTFKAELLVTKEAPKAAYQKETTGSSESQWAMLKRLELSEQAHRELKGYCEKRKIIFLASPFDETCANFLDDLGVTMFKIPSGELTNLPFLKAVALKNKPMIVSTGMATMTEVQAAIRVIRETGNNQITLLHCVSNYPADPVEVNLRAMQTMVQELGLPVGLSDHTLGIEISLAAVALGARVIEKHFTLDHNLPGPDHRISLVPEELNQLVEGIRKIEKALGDGIKKPSSSELEIAQVARKSLVAATNITRGSFVKREWIVIKRPGSGLPPSKLSAIVGLRVRRDIAEGEILKEEMFE